MDIWLYIIRCTLDDIHSVYRKYLCLRQTFCRIHLVTITLCPLTTSAFEIVANTNLT
jgi:hypothetical protein